MTPRQRMSRWLARVVNPNGGDVYIGLQLLPCRVIETEKIPTMAVDGVNLYFNPEFVAKLTDKKGESIVIHEGWHIALGHHLRRGNRDPKLYNIAADLAINSYLIGAQYDISDGCIPGQGPFKHLPLSQSAEWYYAELAKNPPPPQGGAAGKDGSGGEGEVLDHPGTGDGKLEDLVRDWECQQINAAQTAQQAGKTPGYLTQLLDKLLAKPEVPWHTLLRRFMDRLSFDGYSYSRFNRRFPDGLDGCRIPAKRATNSGDIVYAFDSSGSMDEQALAKALAEADSILAKFPGSTCRVLQCDTQVAYDKTFTGNDSPLAKKVAVHGRGGTSFQPVFEALKKVGPRCLIYFTDGYGDWESCKKPAYPVVWVITKEGVTGKAPFGTTIRLKG